jgi:hypothetical protein
VKGGLVFVILAACGEGRGSVTAALSVPILTTNGSGPSYLEKYVGQTISLEIDFGEYRVARAESPGCGETIVYTPVAIRTATGPTAADFTAEVLDPISGWELSLEVCDTATSSSIVLVGAIDAINTSFGCGGIPDSLQHRNSDGHPQLQTFTATRCNAIILDVPMAFSVGNPDFEMEIRTDSIVQ